jgi:DNA repair photolyase
MFIFAKRKEQNFMIINTGCRTDIPAFYSKWLMNRIREGYVLTRNPYYRNQVTRYSLSPEVVDCLAFCTKNPKPMLEYLDELDIYRQYWFVTITPYGKDVEPMVPDKNEVIESFKKLSNHIGVDSIGWRYDPIFIGNGFDVKKHIESFEKMTKALKGYTHDVTISFLDLYEKVKRNAPDIRPPSKEESIEIGKAFSKIAKENDMIVHSCCEKIYLSEFGVDCSGCMSQAIVEKGIGQKLTPPKRKNIREDCNCLMGNDIGAYNTCLHLCKYCYANANAGLVRENAKRHIPTSPFLIGREEPGDKITNAKQVSWITKSEDVEQISLI